MDLGSQASETNAGRLATARYDRESASRSGSDELPPAGAFCLANILRIPVGYEDDTGFHHGEPQMDERQFFEQKANITGTYQF